MIAWYLFFKTETVHQLYHVRWMNLFSTRFLKGEGCWPPIWKKLGWLNHGGGGGKGGSANVWTFWSIFLSAPLRGPLYVGGGGRGQGWSGLRTTIFLFLHPSPKLFRGWYQWQGIWYTGFILFATHSLYIIEKAEVLSDFSSFKYSFLRLQW